MALNPFFLQGSPGEQRLIQELINEQLKIYGVEVIYIPRKFVRRESIIEEVTSSKFDDNFGIEAYVNNYEGYTGAGDVLTKFGMSLRDELSLIISKERFEDFIGAFLNDIPDSEIGVATRPKEGDIIYFPLGKRLFEVKFVEHEKPFYQLGKTYVYELQCELFEYEDEMGGWDNINTTTEEIDSQLEGFGYITSLQLISFGQQATGAATTSTGYVRRIILTNDGYDYTSIPTVAISTAPQGGTNATAVAITTSILDTYSVKEILLTNAGAGYTQPPTVTISGGGGVGAAATCEIVTAYAGISTIGIQTFGSGYPIVPSITIGSGITTTYSVSVPNGISFGYYLNGIQKPTLTFFRGIQYTFDLTDPTLSNHPLEISTTNDGVHQGGSQYTDGWTSDGNTATLSITDTTPNTLYYYCAAHSEMGGKIDIVDDYRVAASAIIGINTLGNTSQVFIRDAGIGYAQAPTITIAEPPVLTGIGTFIFNEVVTGSVSGARGRVKTWDSDTNVLKVGVTDGDFVPGDIIVGSDSSARYSLDEVSEEGFADKYEQNDEIEEEADLIIDFTEKNPFGNY